MTAIAGISAMALENARRLQWLEQENERLTIEVSQERSLVGEGAQMKEVYQFLKRVAPTESTVLIEGESGTGKEPAARALHRNSPRADKPFVAINCAAIPETLAGKRSLRSRTGRIHRSPGQKKGRLEVADGGMVFLDEIGELAPALQVKLLRVLQEREFERVGGTHPIKVDIRLIAATNCDLEQAVRDGTFRQDLYYRLAVLKLTMPRCASGATIFPCWRATLCRSTPNAQSEATSDFPRSAVLPGELRLAGQCAGTGKCHRTGAGVGIVRLDSARRFAGIAAGAHSAPEMTEAKYHAAVKELKKQLILRRCRANPRQLRRCGPHSRRASQLSAPPDPQSGIERNS